MVRVVALGTVIALTGAVGVAAYAEERGANYQPAPETYEDTYRNDIRWARVFVNEGEPLGEWSSHRQLVRAYNKGVRKFHVSVPYSTPATVARFGASVPEDVTMVFTDDHEPESETGNRDAAIAEYVRHQRAIRPYVEAAGMIFLPVLMCRTFRPEVGRDPEKYRVPGVPRLGVDCHFRPSQGQEAARTMGLVRTFMERHRLWWWFPEVGAQCHAEGAEQIGIGLTVKSSYARNSPSMLFDGRSSSICPITADAYFDAPGGTP